MADSEDLKLLESGSRDLSRCDFREADLSGLDLKGRNLTHCLLEKAICNNTDFSGSDFTGAQVSFMKAPGAIFDNCKMVGTHFGYVDLSNSSLRNTKATGAQFQNCNLNSANLTGAHFRGGNINQDTTLEAVIADDTTDFEDVTVLRATSRNDLFRAYDFVEGRLKRRTERTIDAAVALEGNLEEQSVPHSDGTQFSDGTGYSVPASDRMVRFNHNEPDYQRVTVALESAIEAVRSTNDPIDNRDAAIQSLNYAKALWQRAELPLLQAKIGIIMAIDDAVLLLKKAAVVALLETAKALVADYLKSKIGPL